MSEWLKASAAKICVLLIGTILPLTSFNANAQSPDVPAPDGSNTVIASEAFFHVEVTGTVPNPISGGATRERRIAKGFAISPDTLIIPRHTLGEVSEWQKIIRPNSPLSRATYEVDRSVWLTSSTGVNRQDVIVLPGFSTETDAAAVRVPSLNVENYFNISMCGLKEESTYKALIANSSPDQAIAFTNLMEVTLIAKGPKPELYGGLYVFEPSNSEIFNLTTTAHEGSPILDDENSVIAFISAIDRARDGNGDLRVFATPIQPLIPPSLLQLFSSSQEDSLGGPNTRSRQPRCSIASAINDMTERVAAYAIWEVILELEERNPTSNLLIRYNGVIDPADISFLEVEYAFLSEVPTSPQDEVRLGDVVEDSANRVPSIDKYTFLLDKIVQRTCVLPPEIRTKVKVLRLSFKPQYKNSRIERRPFTDYIPWSDLTGGSNQLCNEAG